MTDWSVKTVLVADDEDMIRELMVMSFSLEGFRVLEASSAEEALTIISSTYVDAIVSDIRMPKGDGVHLLRRVKELYPKKPFLFLSGFTDLSVAEGFNLGADAFFTKPFDLDSLSDHVKHVLNPLESRWASPPPGGADEAKSIFRAVGSEDFRLGKGGFFLRDDSPEIEVGEAVNFRLEGVPSVSAPMEGLGRVRWVRRPGEMDAPSGYGIQIQWIGDETRDRLIERIKLMDSVAVIPFR